MTWYFWVLDCCCCCNQHPTSSWWQQCPDSIWHQSESRGEMCVFVKDPIFHTVPINNKGNTNDIEGHKCCCYEKKRHKKYIYLMMELMKWKFVDYWLLCPQKFFIFTNCLAAAAYIIFCLFARCLRCSQYILRFAQVPSISSSQVGINVGKILQIIINESCISQNIEPIM